MLGRVGHTRTYTLGDIAEDLSGEGCGGRTKNPLALAMGSVNNPMAEGRIYLINDLPAAAKTVGRDYCEALKCWLNPLVWRKFIAKWNKIHPDIKI